MINAYRRMFDYKGRSGRKELWSFYVQVLATAIVIAISDTVLSMFVSDGTVRRLPVLLYLVFCYSLALPLLALLARRLHDWGWSAKILLIFPLIGPVFFLALLRPGAPGANKYGSSPAGSE